ncbi:MAG TPA: ubiquinol-cytochrome c reductase iron-sulfur subunit [Solirubrobacteraceae bacterium]|nr:ubiquinol-cytochrome c reductase iron-sulfur subunit [Solirubrobacteraceae bacterium]
MQDRHKATQAKSKYTADRGMPGTFDGETVTRRRFMTAVTHSAGGVAAMAFTLPALGFALGPLFSREPFSWQPIGKPEDFVDSTYVTRVVTIVEGMGEAGNSIAYVRTRNPAIDKEPGDKYNRWVALSSRCMHLGCPVRFVNAAQRFICPCHGGVYDFRGLVAGGPPVRPLDRFYTRLNSNTGLVEIGPRYSVNSELTRYSPRDPGQPLDGIGQYLYPKRFSTSILPGT